jgi:hypothetical protein
MKIRFLILELLVLSTIAAFAQQSKPGSASPPVNLSGPQFFALSVADLDESVRWYQTNFGLGIAKTINSPDGNVRIAILRSEDLLIELLQHKESVPARNCNPKPADGYLIQGVFKVGFYVKNLDRIIKELKTRKVEFDTDLIESKDLKMKFVLIRDNSGNTLQIFQQL